MSQALYTGISGLRTHQLKLDVVANNLANMNTTAYKSQSTVFSDLIYNRFRSGSAASANTGGSNPQFIGTGVQMAQIAKKFTQGALQSTGELLDFAIQGEGFFTLANSTGENVFSRAGSFGLDADGQLVDPATGYLVQRFGTAGEADDGNPGFQIPGDKSIRVPIGAAVPGGATANADIFGNLPSDASPPIAEVLSSFAPFQTAGGAATLTDTLDSLTINAANYVAGDTLTISGTNPDGTPFTGSLAANGATMGDLVTQINSLVTGATASLAPDGTLALTADSTGDAFLSLVIEDSAGNTGDIDFAGHPMVVSSDGNDGDRYELSMEVFDGRGQAHRLLLDFHKVGLNTWDMTASLNNATGTFLDDTVTNITFNEDGSYSIAGTTGVGDADIEINFDALTLPQTIALDFSQMTHLATGFSLTQEQDGFPPGNLVAVEVSADGMVSGLATNGSVFELAQLAIAGFSNNKGLNPLGQNFYRETPASGPSSIGAGAEASRGAVVGGQLESSNVDIALEFTQLIIAQRGFSANSRTITIASEMLEELTNIVR
ncbi:MAG: flagellar hook protein FlgE [Pirellulaceae bacterium]